RRLTPRHAFPARHRDRGDPRRCAHWGAAMSAATVANTDFAALKQVEAGLLNVGYVELGPAAGKPVLLLHGWPYDTHSFIEVAPLLAAKGYRAIAPYVRGHGTTRFLSAETMRNGQQGAVALDAIAF